MRHRLRVIQIAHSFPPYIGGLSYVVENLSLELVRRGHEVEVVTLDIGKKLPGEENYRGVLVKRFRGWAPAGGYFAPSLGFYQYVRKASADIFHLHNIGALTVPVAWIALKRSRKKYVVTPHYHESGYAWHAALLWRPYRLVARRILKQAKRVHSVSEYEASLIEKSFKVKPIIIYNGVAEDVLEYSWSPPEDRIVLVYAGRVEHYKRVDLVVDLAKKVMEKTRIKTIAKIIGRGPALPKVLARARSKGVLLEHYDFLPRKKYLEHIAGSSMLVNLSQYEAYSIVVAEALAMKVPVIVAKPWGWTFSRIPIARIVDPENIEEAASIAAKILLEKPATIKRPFIPSWREVAKKIEEIYQEALRDT